MRDRAPPRSEILDPAMDRTGGNNQHNINKVDYNAMERQRDKGQSEKKTPQATPAVSVDHSACIGRRILRTVVRRIRGRKGYTL